MHLFRDEILHVITKSKIRKILAFTSAAGPGINQPSILWCFITMSHFHFVYTPSILSYRKITWCVDKNQNAEHLSSARKYRKHSMSKESTSLLIENHLYDINNELFDRVQGRRRHPAMIAARRSVPTESWLLRGLFQLHRRLPQELRPLLHQLL